MSYKDRKIAQVIVTQSTTETACTATTPAIDTSIPQNTEGNALAEYDTTITPTNASSTLLIEAVIQVDTNAATYCSLSLFVDSTADAIAVTSSYMRGNGFSQQICLRYKVTASTTLPRTYKLRLGKPTVSTITTNQISALANAFGVSCLSTLTITEILP
jgi:hypothetical protein